MSRAKRAAVAFAVLLLALGGRKLATGAELRKHALVIGINGLGLNFADQDAQAFASFIETRQGGNFPSANVRLQVNGQASREGILVQGIAWVGKRVREDRERGYETLVYIFFAGHGQKRPTTDEAYLLPAGADPEAPQGLGIRADDFVAEIRKEIQASRIVYFLDACHAGASVTQGGIAREVASNVYSSLDPLFQKDLARQPISRMGFLSAQPHQESYEDPNVGHGVFTHYLLRGLQWLEADQKPFGNDDGVVTADELARYLDVKVPAHVKGMFAGVSDPPRQYPEPSPGYDHEFPLAFKPRPASERMVSRPAPSEADEKGSTKDAVDVIRYEGFPGEELMWPTRDNGFDLDWNAARQFCENLTLRGYRDWRLPHPLELDTLSGLRTGTIKPGIALTSSSLWATGAPSDPVHAYVWTPSQIGFRTALKIDADHRVLCVRGGRK
jgi:hypothetical protein